MRVTTQYLVLETDTAARPEQIGKPLYILPVGTSEEAANSFLESLEQKPYTSIKLLKVPLANCDARNVSVLGDK